MIVITRKVPAREICSYQCEVCGQKYRHQTQAQKCESRQLEVKQFNIGDVVEIKEPHSCARGKEYFFTGIVTKVQGPMPSDFDYETRWLGAQPGRINGHVYKYEVEFFCPRCKQKKAALFYTPELNSSRMVKKTGPPENELQKKYQSR